MKTFFSSHVKIKGLPSNWSAWKAPSGELFYCNGTTGVFTWQQPALISPPTQSTTR